MGKRSKLKCEYCGEPCGDACDHCGEIVCDACYEYHVDKEHPEAG